MSKKIRQALEFKIKHFKDLKLIHLALHKLVTLNKVYIIRLNNSKYQRFNVKVLNLFLKNNNIFYESFSKIYFLFSKH